MLVVKIPLYLELVRCQIGQKLSNQSLITTSSSFVAVCSDKTDRVAESADKGWPKVLDIGQFHFRDCSPLWIRSSFIIWFQSLGRSSKRSNLFLCWSKKPRVVFKLRCQKFCVPCHRLCQPPLPFLSMLPFSQTYVFRVFQEISKGLNTSLIVSMFRTATSVTKITLV